MSIAREIARLQQAKADIADAIVAKGGEVSGTIDNYAQAIEALPSGGGGSVAVLEGDITLTSANSNILIEHNLGVIPFLAVVDVVGEYDPASNKSLSVKNWINPLGGWCRYFNSSLAETQIAPAANPTMQFNDSYVQLFTGSVSRTFYPTTYHYKIYYEV